MVGWETTRYADAQLHAVATAKSEPITFWVGERTKTASWVGKGEYVSGKTLYLSGISSMALGAAFVVFAFPRGSWHPAAGRP